MILKTEIFPPKIPIEFNYLLLSTPYPKFGDSLQSFDRMWTKVLKRWGNLDKNPKNKEKCEQLKREILELYERAKVKEKEREGQASHETQRFMYSVPLSEEMARNVCIRLVLGFSVSRERKCFHRSYHALHKAKLNTKRKIK